MSEYQQLSPNERYLIARMRQKGYTQSDIAWCLGRPRCTISRELRRNRSHHDGGYRHEVAQRYTDARRKRERRGSQYTKRQWRRVKQKLKRLWSPEQIAGRLKADGKLSISHETIYRWIRRDRKRGGKLYTYCRIMKKYGRKGYGVKDSRGRLEGKRHICERPAEVETRLVVGHWEGDTVMGKDRYHGVLTLVERATGLAIIKKIVARTAENVAAAAKQAISRHKDKFITLTLDNGTEFHNYQQIEAASSVICYFATPYHAWERGSNENFNGLLRQYLPKGTSMKDLNQEECNRIAMELNTRPRKRLGWKTPKEVYDAAA
jgi:transposase, IS30 family